MSAGVAPAPSHPVAPALGLLAVGLVLLAAAGATGSPALGVGWWVLVGLSGGYAVSGSV